MNERPLVLLIEDNPADATLLEQTFAECAIDARIVSVDNAVKAFSFMRGRGIYAGERMPDLVVLDLNLPVISGYQILDVIKKEPAWRAVRILVLSSSIKDRERAQHEVRGLIEFFPKPTSLPGFVELGRVLKQLLKSSTLTQA